ncbi:MAG: hypothetical protein Q9192_005042 [Flavoplaca navasiana]
MPLPRSLRLSSRLLPPYRSLTTTTHPLSEPNNSPSWSGRQPSEHVTNRTDELDVHSGASKSGARQRVEDNEHEGSSATKQKDPGNQNEKAKRDHPEAPGPVIGMNDERGGHIMLPNGDYFILRNSDTTSTFDVCQRCITHDLPRTLFDRRLFLHQDAVPENGIVARSTGAETMDIPDRKYWD